MHVATYIIDLMELFLLADNLLCLLLNTFTIVAVRNMALIYSREYKQTILYLYT